MTCDALKRRMSCDMRRPQKGERHEKCRHPQKESHVTSVENRLFVTVDNSAQCGFYEKCKHYDMLDVMPSKGE